jgi:hypothetical protein
MATTTTITEADILEKIVAPHQGNMDPQAAWAILQLRFDGTTTKQIRNLLRKNNRGAISAPERLMLEKFLRVGKLVDLLHAKAHLSLRQSVGASVLELGALD